MATEENQEYAFVPYTISNIEPQEQTARANQFFSDMNSRRSVREFDQRPIPRALVETLIRTASTAPSGAHKQPWTFVAIRNHDLKQQIRSAAEKEEKDTYGRRMPEDWKKDLRPLGVDWRKPHITQASWVIVVFAQEYGLDSAGDKSKHYYVKESVGIAVGLFLAAASYAGLSTLTHTPSPMGFLSEVLNRPSNERAYVLIPLGYPHPECRVPDLQRKSLQEVSVWYE